MWIKDYDSRLRSWRLLRDKLASELIEDQLYCINEWWAQAPVTSNVIHWQDQKNWPNPWELLAELAYDELAKALGIVYTILLVNDRAEVSIMRIMDTYGNDCIVVLVNNKYILNWDTDTVISTQDQEFKVQEMLDCNTLKEKVI